MRWLPYAAKLVSFQHFGYEPSELQARVHQMLEPELELPQVLLILGGERAGKSTVAAHEVAAQVPVCNLVFLAGESYENAEPEFDYIERALRETGNLGSMSKPKRGQWSMQARTGCQFQTISFARDGADALIATGKAPDIVLMCEAGLTEFSWFQAAFGRVAERRGAVIASGTLKSAKPWYADKFREFQADNPYHGKSISLPSWGNLAVYPGGRDDPVIKAMERSYDDLTFRERFGAEPVPSGLLVFGREFSYEMHVRDLEYNPALPVELAIDPGYAGAYAVLVVQWAGPSDVLVIDEFYQQYATWDQAVEWMRGLPYGDKISTGVADVAIRQHHGDRSQYEQWRSRGVELKSGPVSIEDGISRMRDFLRSPFTGTPRLAIDPKCKGLLMEFGHEMYRADQDGQPLKEDPIDRYNHSRKALSYWLVWRFGRSDFKKETETVPDRIDYWARAKNQKKRRV